MKYYFENLIDSRTGRKAFVEVSFKEWFSMKFGKRKKQLEVISNRAKESADKIKNQTRKINPFDFVIGNEQIPWQVFLYASEVGTITEEDIKWAKSVMEKI